MKKVAGPTKVAGTARMEETSDKNHATARNSMSLPSSLPIHVIQFSNVHFSGRSNWTLYGHRKILKLPDLDCNLHYNPA